MRSAIQRIVVALGVAGAAILPLLVTNAGADTLWLDRALENWNTPGMAVPAAPRSDFMGNEAFRVTSNRPAETPEDTAVVNAGWTLFGSYQSGWGTRIVGARVGLDGMCRPMDFQYFVFVNGRLAGTVSPVAMGARSDGSASTPNLTSGGKSVYVEFARYTASDPLCCPSATTSVSYRIDTVGGAPLLVPDNAYTTQSSS